MYQMLKNIFVVSRNEGCLPQITSLLKLVCFVFYFSVLIHEPSVLIEGVLFRARYLGSTQLVCEGQPTKSTRMMQAEEAVSRIKVSLRLFFFFFVNRFVSKIYGF